MLMFMLRPQLLALLSLLLLYYCWRGRMTVTYPYTRGAKSITVHASALWKRSCPTDGPSAFRIGPVTLDPDNENEKDDADVEGTGSAEWERSDELVPNELCIELELEDQDHVEYNVEYEATSRSMSRPRSSNAAPSTLRSLKRTMFVFRIYIISIC